MKQVLKKVGLILAIILGANILMNIFIWSLITLSLSQIFDKGHENCYLEIAERYGISIPEEWTQFYYNIGTYGGSGGDVDYFVFEVSTENDEFFSEFSQEKDEKFEKYINGAIESKFNNRRTIESEYMFDFAQSYNWFAPYKDYYWSSIGGIAGIYFISQSDRLYVFADWAGDYVIPSQTAHLEYPILIEGQY